MPADASLRDRKKRQSRDLLVATALDLFEDLGFDAVTVDQITARAELSPRTFFRYFGSKEAVLFADQEEILELLSSAIGDRPDEEPPLDALRNALVANAGHYDAHRDFHLRRRRLMQQGAALGAYQRTVLLPQWEAVLAEAMAARIDVDLETDLRPRLLAGVALAAMTAAGGVWVAGGGAADVSDLLERAFSALGDAVLESLAAL